MKIYINEQSILKILPINCNWCSCNLSWCDERYFLPFPQQKILLWHFLYNMLIKLVFIRVFFFLQAFVPSTCLQRSTRFNFCNFFLKSEHYLIYLFLWRHINVLYFKSCSQQLNLNTTCRSTLVLLSCLRYFYTSLFPYPT